MAWQRAFDLFDHPSVRRHIHQWADDRLWPADSASPGICYSTRICRKQRRKSIGLCSYFPNLTTISRFTKVLVWFPITRYSRTAFIFLIQNVTVWQIRVPRFRFVRLQTCFWGVAWCSQIVLCAINCHFLSVPTSGAEPVFRCCRRCRKCTKLRSRPETG